MYLRDKANAGCRIVRAKFALTGGNAMLKGLTAAALLIVGCFNQAPEGKVTTTVARPTSTIDGYGAVTLADKDREGSPWAIIVGINEYGSERPALRTAVNGAVHLRNLLRDEFGYAEEKTFLLLNADTALIIETLKRVVTSDRVSPNDSILFYFAGHGTPDGILAGTDSDARKVVAEELSVALLRELLLSSKFLRKAVILDSCFSGHLFDRTPQVTPADRNLGVFFGLSAARPAEFAFDVSDDAEFSPFTKHLLHLLTERANSHETDHRFTLARVADEVRMRVSRETIGTQEPKWGYLGPGGGDFAFRETVRRPTPQEQEQLNKVRQSRLARTRRLILASRNCRESHPQRSLLLAVEATRTLDDEPPTPESHENLRNALRTIGGSTVIRSTKPINCITLGPKGRWLFVDCDEKNVRALDLASTESQWKSLNVAGHVGRIDAMAINRDGTLMATGSEDGSVQVISLKDGGPSPKPTIQVRLHNSWVTTVSFSDDGKWLASGSIDGVVRLWSIVDGRLPKFPVRLQGNDIEWVSMKLAHFTSDSKYLWTVSSGGSIYVWRLADIEPDPQGDFSSLKVGAPLANAAHFSCLAVAPSGNRMATGDGEGVISLWTIESEGRRLSSTRLTGHEGVVRALIFAPNGNRLLSGSTDGTTRLWLLDPTDGDVKSQILQANADTVESAAFSITGELAATGSADQTIRLWNLTGAVPNTIGVLRGHEGGITAVKFTDDERMLLTVGRDNSLRRWPIEQKASPSPSALMSGFFVDFCG